MRKWILVLVTVAVGTLCVACGGGSSSSKSSSSTSDTTAATLAEPNTFGLSEFTIIPPSNALHAGTVLITANNLGAEVHELVIVRADSVESLVKRGDGSVEEAMIASGDKVAEIEDITSGARKSATVNLTPGTYVAVCNLVDDMTAPSTMMHGGSMTGAGHVHFAEGMHTTFTVN